MVKPDYLHVHSLHTDLISNREIKDQMRGMDGVGVIPVVLVSVS